MKTADGNVLEALPDSRDRGNPIVLGVLRGLGARAVEDGPSVAQMLTHLHAVRLAFVAENAPEFAGHVPREEWPEREWVDGRDPDRVARMLKVSARAVRAALKGRVEAGRDLDLHSDHPALFRHEGSRQGQIKLVRKLAGLALTGPVAGPVTWGVWMRKARAGG